MSEHLPQPPNPGPGGWNPAGPYATSSMPLPPMRALRGLATALLVLFILVALTQLGAAGARFNRASLIDDVIESPSSVDQQDLIDADDTVAGLSGLHALGMLATGIVFIIWQFRHAKNATVLGNQSGLGPGWAIGGWFVPLGNLVIPGVQLFQSSKASDVTARQQGQPPKGAPVVVLWAVAFGLGVVLLAAGGALAPGTDDEGNFDVDSIEDIEDVASSDRTAGAGHVVLFGAAILGIVMVRRLSAKQLAAWPSAATAAGPPPGPPSAWGAPAAPPPPPPPSPPLPPPPGAPPPPPT